MSDVEKVTAAVRTYCSKYSISVFEISSEQRINDLRQRKKNVEWPHGDQSGCYAMYDGSKNLLYIGLAGHIASRLNSWFRYKEREDAQMPWTSYAVGTWQTQPVFLQTIKTHEPYEAPSLEAFLIAKLDPCENINLRSVPETAKITNGLGPTDTWDQLASRFELLAYQIDTGIATKDGPSQEIMSRLAELEREILNAEADTIEGLIIKAKVACWTMLGDWDPRQYETVAERMAFSIVQDLIRKYAPHLLKPGAIDELLSDL
jgi:hypothetical protein